MSSINVNASTMLYDEEQLFIDNLVLADEEKVWKEKKASLEISM